MAERSAIEWTQATWNPVVGCTQISPGCTHCYAMEEAARQVRCAKGLGRETHYEGTVKQVNGRALWTGKVVAAPQHILERPLHWAKPKRIFVNSMSDLFHEDLPDAGRDRIFAIMALCPQHTFQVLTKRPKRMQSYINDPKTPFRVAEAMDAITGTPLEEEEIKAIEGYPGYFITSHGRVLSDKRGPRRTMKPDVGEEGHSRVQLHRDGSGRYGDRILVHHLVLEAFVGPRPTPDAQGRHLDRTPTNNAANNLVWGDQSANWDDRRRHGRHRPYSKLTDVQAIEIRKRSAAGETGEALGREFGISGTQARNIASGKQWAVSSPIEWPLPNCWKGVTAENQKAADERIPLLLATQAAVRWVSVEPMLGQINLKPWLSDCYECGLSCGWRGEAPAEERCNACGECSETFGELCRCGTQDFSRICPECGHDAVTGHPDTVTIDWVVGGFESGPNGRPGDFANAYSLRDQCSASLTPFLWKQNGEFVPVSEVSGARRHFKFGDGTIVRRVGKKAAGRLLDGVLHDAYPEVPK